MDKKDEEVGSPPIKKQKRSNLKAAAAALIAKEVISEFIKWILEP